MYGHTCWGLIHDGAEWKLRGSSTAKYAVWSHRGGLRGIQGWSARRLRAWGGPWRHRGARARGHVSLLKMSLLGRVPIIVYGCYGPTPASKTNHFFALLISRPSSCVHLESVKKSFDDSEICRIIFQFNKIWSAKSRCPYFLRKDEGCIDSS